MRNLREVGCWDTVTVKTLTGDGTVKTRFKDMWYT